MNETFYNWGLPVGRIAGISVRVHWLLLVFWASELARLVRYPIPRAQALALWAILVGLTLFCILFHELGHCFAARKVGGGAREILLWPLGGLAFVWAPHLSKSQLVVAAGGPAANLLLVLASYAVFGVVGTEALGPAGEPYLGLAAWVLLRLNVVLLVFNLIPFYPLDGGRIFHALLWDYLAHHRGEGHAGYVRASVITVWTSRAFALAGIAYAFYAQSLTLGCIVVWAWMGAENLLRRVQSGEGEDYTFGYDFSRGYAGVEVRAPRPGGSRRARALGFLARWFRRIRPAADESRRLDEILDQISREGLASLTRRQRRFLERYSRKRHRADGRIGGPT